MSSQETPLRTTEQPAYIQTFLSEEEPYEDNATPVHEWRELVQRQRTHCVLGDRALTLMEFEELHDHIVLGQN